MKILLEEERHCQHQLILMVHVTPSFDQGSPFPISGGAG